MKDSAIETATDEDLARVCGSVSRCEPDAILENRRLVTVRLPEKPLRCWTFVADTPPELLSSIEWPNMPQVLVTSDLVALDLDLGLAETRSRSVYGLGRRAEGRMPQDVQREVLHRFWSHR